MSKRYDVPQLTRIYGRSVQPIDTPALIELKRWRTQADQLIRDDQVAAGLDLIDATSKLTQEYRRSRVAHLAPRDRLKLILASTPVQSELLPAGEVQA